jgi:hypothetical protein
MLRLLLERLEVWRASPGMRIRACAYLALRSLFQALQPLKLTSGHSLYSAVMMTLVPI